MAIPNLGFVQHSVAHAGEQVGFFVEGVAQVAVLDQFEEDMMESILRAAAFSGDGRGEKQESRTVLAVERLNLGGVGAVGVHDSVSMIGQSGGRDLSKDFREDRGAN
jgi:hypothetical protein